MAMFDALSGKLQGVFATLGRRGAITEKDLEAALREVRLALLEADVNYKVARDFIKAVRGRANSDEVMKSPTPLNRVVEIINEELNAAFEKAATDLESPLNGILDYTDEPLVSSDFKGSPASSIIDALSTMVLEGTQVKVVSWYDNEWGYSVRVGDLCVRMAEAGLS